VAVMGTRGGKEPAILIQAQYLSRQLLQWQGYRLTVVKNFP
jgi:hypothetical protein